MNSVSSLSTIAIFRWILTTEKVPGGDNCTDENYLLSRLPRFNIDESGNLYSQIQTVHVCQALMKLMVQGNNNNPLTTALAYNKKGET